MADFLSFSARDKVVDAADAVRLIRDGDAVVVGGFGGIGFAEHLVLALEERFRTDGGPRGLTLVFTVATGDRRGRGIDHLCHDGLIARAIGGHWGMSVALPKMAVENRIEAWNLPQGVISQLFRDTAAGKPGLVTRVGLGTFVDPRHGGGKVNQRTTEDRVHLLEIAGEEYLFYPALPLDVALLRATTADRDGNITMEREALTLEALAVATAVHNAGGLVVVQVERIAERGSLPPRQVKIPGALVDCVVVAPPERHSQTFGTPYSAAFSGELRVPAGSAAPMPLDARKVIARRAALELRPGSVVNLGVGMPEGVAAVAAEEHVLDYLVLTAEPGVIGGLPAGGLDFGAAVNAQAVLDQPYQFDFYDGGGLDAAFLGMAQADAAGNVNVSRFGPKLAGSGGFINISQNAKRLVFLGTFVAGSTAKFVAEVEQRTFSGPYAAGRGQPVLYVTERCVFRLTPDGLELTEIAPGVDLKADILALMDFEPVIRTDPVLMDGRIFRPEPMGLAAELLTVPMHARFAYDPEQNLFFLNLSGVTVTTADQIDDFVTEIDRQLAAAGRRVHLVVNYDNFSLAPHLMDTYLAAVDALSDRYYASVTRYSTSAFLRLKLGGMLAGRGVAPHVYESRQEAVSWAGR